MQTSNASLNDVQFSAQTGMRQEEAVSLEWSQVSIERREIRLTKIKASAPRVMSPSDKALGTLVAEGVGFEPTVELPPRRFSRPLP